MKKISPVFASLFFLLLGSFSNQLFAQTAVIDKVWIEHNVILNGVKGMKIFTNFHVNNAAGRTLDLSVNHYFIYKGNGGPVRGKTTGHWAPGPDGNPQACAWQRSNYDIRRNPTYLNNNWVFAPYSDLVIPPGNFSLGIVTFIRDCGKEQFIQESTKNTYFTYGDGSSRILDPNKQKTPSRVSPTPLPQTPSSSKCAACYGLGKCSTCYGTGISKYSNRKCGACNGTGRCRTCDGLGHL